MNLATEILGGVVIAFIGFNIGSVVEYYKKYNLYDLEKDKTANLIGTLHGFLQTLLYHVENTFHRTASQVAAATTPQSNG